MIASIYHCLIVDDEPIARQILQNYVNQTPNLECVGECKNAFEALEKINADARIQIVFLDINMPNLSGTAMARILSRKLQVIFTTAYSEYAVESYELDAADYLLKPFLFERFTQAVFKAAERLRTTDPETQFVQKQSAAPSFFIKSDGENFRVELQEILYCEAMKNYTKVVLKGGRTLFPLIAISKMEEELRQLGNDFLRVHRSFLVSQKHLSAVGANYLRIDKFKIPIGFQYKAMLFESLGIKSKDA